MTTLRIFCGSRALATSDARVWVRTEIRQRIVDVDVVVTGDARGPDSVTRAVCLELHKPCYRYLLDGRIACDGDLTERFWTRDSLPDSEDRIAWKEWCLRRDRVMVEHAAVRLAEGYDVKGVALIAPWSKTYGTEYTARYAEKLEINMERLVAPLESNL